MSSYSFTQQLILSQTPKKYHHYRITWHPNVGLHPWPSIPRKIYKWEDDIKNHESTPFTWSWNFLELKTHWDEDAAWIFYVWIYIENEDHQTGWNPSGMGKLFLSDLINNPHPTSFQVPIHILQVNDDFATLKITWNATPLMTTYQPLFNKKPMSLIPSNKNKIDRWAVSMVDRMMDQFDHRIKHLSVKQLDALHACYFNASNYKNLPGLLYSLQQPETPIHEFFFLQCGETACRHMGLTFTEFITDSTPTNSPSSYRYRNACAVLAYTLIAYTTTIPYNNDYFIKSNGQIQETDIWLSVLVTGMGDCEDMAHVLNQIVIQLLKLVATHPFVKALQTLMKQYTCGALLCSVTSAKSVANEKNILSVFQKAHEEPMMGHFTCLLIPNHLLKKLLSKGLDPTFDSLFPHSGLIQPQHVKDLIQTHLPAVSIYDKEPLLLLEGTGFCEVLRTSDEKSEFRQIHGRSLKQVHQAFKQKKIPNRYSIFLETSDNDLFFTGYAALLYVPQWVNIEEIHPQKELTVAEQEKLIFMELTFCHINRSRDVLEYGVSLKKLIENKEEELQDIALWPTNHMKASDIQQGLRILSELTPSPPFHGPSYHPELNNAYFSQLKDTKNTRFLFPIQYQTQVWKGPKEAKFNNIDIVITDGDCCSTSLLEQITEVLVTNKWWYEWNYEPLGRKGRLMIMIWT